MIKSVAIALITAASTLGAGAAHAGGHVSWSIGINTPVYAPAPVYVSQPPVYVSAPVPVYQEEPQVAYYPPRAVYYQPAPVVVYRPYYRGWHHRHHPHWDDRGWGRD